MNDKPDEEYTCCGHDHSKKSGIISKVFVAVVMCLAAGVLVLNMIRIFSKATGTTLVLP